jgi:hypothetical protein
VTSGYQKEMPQFNRSPKQVSDSEPATLIARWLTSPVIEAKQQELSV